MNSWNKPSMTPIPYRSSTLMKMILRGLRSHSALSPEIPLLDPSRFPLEETGLVDATKVLPEMTMMEEEAEVEEEEVG